MRLALGPQTDISPHLVSKLPEAERSRVPSPRVGSGISWSRNRSRCLALEGLVQVWTDQVWDPFSPKTLHAAGDPGLYFRCCFMCLTENSCPKLVESVRCLPSDPPAGGEVCFLALVRLGLAT